MRAMQRIAAISVVIGAIAAAAGAALHHYLMGARRGCLTVMPASFDGPALRNTSDQAVLLVSRCRDEQHTITERSVFLESGDWEWVEGELIVRQGARLELAVTPTHCGEPASDQR